VDGSVTDSLADYVAGKPGWLVVRVDASDAAARVRTHISHNWDPAELEPPMSESWDRVGEAVVGFLDSSLAPRSSKA
jgi:hypothetical protein